MKIIESPPNMAVSLLFSSARNEHYLFNISANRRFALAKWRHTEVAAPAMISWTPITIEFEPKDWNTMKVVVDEQLIRLYLNSKLLGEYRDIEFTGGQVGLGVSMYETGGAVLDFDNLRFRRKP
jgi:hypothetical protein